jgi:hypothetical protein
MDDKADIWRMKGVEAMTTKYSCETCTNKEKVHDGKGPCWIRCVPGRCELTHERTSLIKRVGCNSHSDIKPNAIKALEILEEFTWLRYKECRIAKTGMEEHCDIRGEIIRLQQELK